MFGVVLVVAAAFDAVAFARRVLILLLYQTGDLTINSCFLCILSTTRASASFCAASNVSFRKTAPQSRQN